MENTFEQLQVNEDREQKLVVSPKSSSAPIRITEVSAMESFTVPIFYEPYLEGCLLSYGTIQSRVHKMAQDIANYYKDRPFVILVVLKGGFVTFSDLFKSLQEIYSNNNSFRNHLIPEFVRLKSYNDEASTGSVACIGLDMIDLKDKEVLIVDDIVDSGLTMRYLIDAVTKKEAKSVKVFSLLLKEGRTTFDFPVDYVGFIIPDTFVVGYGLDYNEYFRDLRHICVLNREGKQAFKAKIKKAL